MKSGNTYEVYSTYVLQMGKLEQINQQQIST